MLSLLCRSARQSHSTFSISTALAVATAGRLRCSSTSGPEWISTRQYASKSNTERARRYATDPEYREKCLAQARAYIARNSDQVRARAAARKASHDYDKLYYAPKRARWASDDQYKQAQSLRTWLSVRPWVRNLTWRTHQPIMSEKTFDYCGGCEVNKPLKLWWQDKETDEFLCHACFTSDWSRALPIGYEDRVFGHTRRPYKQRKPTTGDKPGPDA